MCPFIVYYCVSESTKARKNNIIQLNKIFLNVLSHSIRNVKFYKGQKQTMKVLIEQKVIEGA
jgi:hypothetical protein